MSTLPAFATGIGDDPGAIPADLLDQLPLIASYVDRDLVYRFVNRAYERWYGVDRSRVLGRTIGLMAGSAAIERVRPQIEAALDGETVRFDTTIASATGERFVRTTYMPRVDADGSVLGFFALVEDMTAKRDADAAIGAALDGLADGYLAINAAAARFYGVSRDAALGRPFEDVFPGLAESETVAMVGETMASGRAARRELRSAARPDRVLMVDTVPLTAGGVGVVVQDLTERRAIETALAAKRELLQSVIEASPDPIFAKNLDGTWRLANRATARALGVEGTDIVGRRDRDFMPAAAAAAIEANDARVFAGETVLTEEVIEDLGIASPTYLVTKAPLRAPDGTIVGLVGTARDISERKDGERHRELLVGELNHRVKNTLAVVQAIAHQTFRPDVDPATARADFSARLKTLAGAHDLLTKNAWDAFQLTDLLTRVLEPFRLGREARFALVGPDVRIEARIAVALALALHELATNALKYGALSTDAGTVAVDWYVRRGSDGARLKLIWREAGGPPVVAPAHEGFGSRLIRRGLSAELRGEAAIDFAPAGVVCRMEVPLPY